MAVTGFGSPDEITVNYFVARGLKLIPVPFASPSERYTAVLGGHADILYEQIGDVRSFVDGKQIQPVIVFSEKRFAVFPDVPASKELGYDIYLENMKGIVAPAGLPDEIYEYLRDRFKKAMETEAFKQMIAKANYEVQYMDGPTFARNMKSMSDAIAGALKK